MMRTELGSALADMALLVGCTKTFEVEYLRRRLEKLDREIAAEPGQLARGRRGST